MSRLSSLPGVHPISDPDGSRSAGRSDSSSQATVDRRGTADGRSNSRSTSRTITRANARLDRRSAMGLMVGASLAGCGRDSAPSGQAVATASRTDVPLRILLCGTEADGEAIKTTWGMSMEQPLQISVIGRQSDASDWSAGWVDQADSVDVLIGPHRLLGDLEAVDAVVPFNPTVLEQYVEDYAKPLAAVANGLGIYGGMQLGVPVGAKLFALLALDSEVRCQTWSEFETWVQSLDGKAAEPLAEGWAAASYLNRCATTVRGGWLFERANLQPELTKPEYVETLATLARTAKLYLSTSKTPSEIWLDLRRGELRGAIGYPVSEEALIESDVPSTGEAEDYDVSVFDCPLETETDRVWFGPDTPVASLSSGCRQTAASKRFIGWLAGSQDVRGLRNQIDGLSITRARETGRSAGGDAAYTRWLEEKLKTPQVIPSLMLPGAERYYQALDREIRRCVVDGEDAGDCLNSAAKQWNVISDQIGRDKQIWAWKRSLGFSG